MNEVWQLIKGLSSLFWRFNTYRGRYEEMPDSTWLCIALGALSLASMIVMIWVEYGWIAAIVAPGIWFPAVWLFTTNGFSMSVNKRLASSVFLLSAPIMLLLSLIGSGHQVIEILVGMQQSTAMLALVGGEQK